MKDTSLVAPGFFPISVNDFFHLPQNKVRPCQFQIYFRIACWQLSLVVLIGNNRGIFFSRTYSLPQILSDLILIVNSLSTTSNFCFKVRDSLMYSTRWVLSHGRKCYGCWYWGQWIFLLQKFRRSFCYLQLDQRHIGKIEFESHLHKLSRVFQWELESENCSRLAHHQEPYEAHMYWKFSQLAPTNPQIFPPDSEIK